MAFFTKEDASGARDGIFCAPDLSAERRPSADRDLFDDRGLSGEWHTPHDPSVDSALPCGGKSDGPRSPINSPRDRDAKFLLDTRWASSALPTTSRAEARSVTGCSVSLTRTNIWPVSAAMRIVWSPIAGSGRIIAIIPAPAIPRTLSTTPIAKARRRLPGTSWTMRVSAQTKACSSCLRTNRYPANCALDVGC